jgi:NTP pyrophosphatase (non-canonical NTP hydrolase)
MHWVLGLCGETGEVAEKLKKIIRDKAGAISEEDKTELAKELGDVLWYLAVFAHDIGFSFDDVAKGNLAKLRDRQARNVLGGSGDNR